MIPTVEIARLVFQSLAQMMGGRLQIDFAQGYLRHHDRGLFVIAIQFQNRFADLKINKQIN